jgi:anti-sigma regulatory factor (Ser/Thr protein kinase)
MSAAPAFRHSAFMYETDDEYATRAAAFLREGLHRGERCIVAHNRAGLALMREALGPDADAVTYVDVSVRYTRPARAVAGYYRGFLEQLRSGPSVRAVAEMQLGPTLDDWAEWESYEAITNLAYAHLPVWVVCTYGASTVPEPILEGVLRTHADQLVADGWVESDRFEDPRQVVRRLTPAPEPLPELRSWSVGDDLERFRERLARDLVTERVPEANTLHMLIAGTEIAANAVRHGGGIAEVRVGRSDGRFVCEVVDRGAGFDDSLTGYLAPATGVGTGLWVARQLTWRLEAFHAPRGFTVRAWL